MLPDKAQQLTAELANRRTHEVEWSATEVSLPACRPALLRRSNGGRCLSPSRWRSRSLRLVPALHLVATGFLACSGVALRSLIRGSVLHDNAHAYRQLRAVEGRSVTQPGLAARDAANASRDLLRSGQGVALDPAQRRVERGLDSVRMQDTQRPGPTAQSARPALSDFPASYDEDRSCRRISRRTSREACSTGPRPASPRAGTIRPGGPRACGVAAAGSADG